MSLDITSNAAEVAADEGFRLVDAQTPRRTGTLAAGARPVVASTGWAVVNPVPYSTVVNARTGYASKTLVDNEARIIAIYDRELQSEFDTI